MRVWMAGLAALLPCLPAAGEPLTGRTLRYLTALVRLDTSNPPGNESRAAYFLQRTAEAEGIPCEVLGGDPQRLNFVARLRGSGAQRPLLLMAHTDVVPAEARQWSVSPFGGVLRDGFIHGRGTIDDKSLLAAELAVLVELKQRRVPLERDVILLAEADEESGSTGMQWMIANAWKKIEAEFAINEGGFAADLPSGIRIFHIQTAEKVPTRAVLRASGTAGHGSLPRPDNPVAEVARALVRLVEAEQPVRFNSTTRRYFTELARLPDYAWLGAPLSKLQREQTAPAAARLVRERDPELDAQLRTTIVPTVFHAGTRVNVIPSSAEAEVDVRRLPNESREEVVARMRRCLQGTGVELTASPDQNMPATEPSSLSTALYREMEKCFRQTAARAVVLPYMQRGATDGSYLRHKGMAVYGAPLFPREDRESRAHGNDERISVQGLAAGTEMLWKIVNAVAAGAGGQ